jgi:hypothetical protein
MERTSRAHHTAVGTFTAPGTTSPASITERAASHHHGHRPASEPSSMM